MSNLNSQELLNLYQGGASEAATEIFDRYVARLVGLARARMAPKLERRLDAEDVVQSAFRSFFVHAADKEYQLRNPGDLWRLLASITINKLHGQIERQTAARRSIHREELIEHSLDGVQAPEPSAAEVVAILEETRLAMNALAPLEQQVFCANLQGDSIETISRAIGKSERTVRRILDDVKHKIEQRLLPHAANHSAMPSAEGEVNAPLHYTDYVLERLLAAGGMGKVFRAKDNRTGQAVAIKALHKSWQTDYRAIGRFLQEAQILAGLSHPHIVRVQGLGRFPSGGYFMVMDFIEGTDLQSRLQKGPLPVAEAIPILRDVTSAIQYAHEQGVVHCDLKPANILINLQGRAYVTDFGFAHLTLGSTRPVTNSVGGTAGYIAPEILHSHQLLSPAADIYALGMILWVSVTGEAPQNIATAQTFDNLPPAIDSICRRCLDPAPNKRYASARAFCDDLDQFVKVSPTKI